MSYFLELCLLSLLPPLWLFHRNCCLSSCWSCSSNLSCGKPAPTLPEFRGLVAFRKPLPAHPLYSHYVRNSHLSHCPRLAFVIFQSTRRAKPTWDGEGHRRTKAQARTNQTLLSRKLNKDHRMIPWHLEWYDAIPRSNIILLCFVLLVFFLLLRSHLRSSASFYTSSGSLFSRRCDCVIPAFMFPLGGVVRPRSLAFLTSSC